MVALLTVAATGVVLHAEVAMPAPSTAATATRAAGMRFTAAMLPGTAVDPGAGAPPDGRRGGCRQSAGTRSRSNWTSTGA